MKRFRDYTAEDLISTDQYQAWTKLPLEGGRYAEPVLRRTFPPYPPLRSAEAIDDIIEGSLDRYGTDPLTDAEIMQNLIYSDANEAANPTKILGETMAEAIRAVQIRERVRSENGWVDVTTVDEELAVRLENSQFDIDYEYEDLPDVRESSRLIEVELQDDDIVTRLSDDGETEVQPETGAVGSAGGPDHDAAIIDAERALTERGFSVDVLEQDGSEQPDATATHPDYDVVFNIEAETTTPDRPAKVLQNLKRAHEADRIPLFVVRPGDPATEWATRIENILSPPLRERADGTEQFYNCDEIVTFGGGATAHGGVTAVRPRTSDTNRTVWTRDDGERVLSDGETEFARVPDEGTLSKDGVPAYYSYDHETGQYTVHQPGETRVYDSKDEFESEWTPIKRPFIPEVELPDADYSRDSYIVLMLPEDGAPVLVQQGETYAFPENPDDEELWPDGPTSEQAQATISMDPGDETPSTGSSAPADESVEIDPSDDGIEAFAAMYIREAEGAQVPKTMLFQAYASWTDKHDIDGTNASWFGRKLANVVEYENDRVRDGADLVTVYTGVDLTPAGSQFLE